MPFGATKNARGSHFSPGTSDLDVGKAREIKQMAQAGFVSGHVEWGVKILEKYIVFFS